MARTVTATITVVADIAALKALDNVAAIVGDTIAVGDKARGVTLYTFVGLPSAAGTDASSSVPGWVKVTHL